MKVLPRTILSRALLINSLVSITWWIIFNPGFYSGDSFAVIEMARNGVLNSDWGSVWALFVSNITWGGRQPQIATLVFSQMLSFSVTMFCFTIAKKYIALAVSIILCLTPLVGAMGITLWHDIPMTSGLLLFCSGFIQALKTSQDQIIEARSLLLMCSGVVLSSFRYNGLPTILLFVLTFILFKKINWKTIFILAFTILLLSFTTILNFQMKSGTNVQSSGFTKWMEYDISCRLADVDRQQNNMVMFGGRISAEEWQSESACRWFTTSQYSKVNSKLSQSEIARAWGEVFLEDPLFIVKTHLVRHAYLVPALVPNMFEIPFIHTTIEFQDKKIAFTFPKLVEDLRVVPRIWNLLRPIFAFSGLWLLVIFVLAFRKRSEIYLWCAVLGFILSASVAIFAVIPDPRFVLFVLIAIFLAVLLEFFESHILSKYGHRRIFQV
jgi:hypothetical protein